MTILPIVLSIVTRILAIGVLAFGALGTASAQGYDLQFLRGGGNGRQIAVNHMCILISEIRTPTSNNVRFLVLFDLPQPNSRIGKFIFDTGRHSALFTSVAVTLQSPGVKSKQITPYSHAFLPTLTPDYWFEIEGFGPGKVFAVSATLGNGKTFGDVVRAIKEGINPATTAAGLRVGLIAYSMTGGPPPGVATVGDDGGFIIKGISPRCGQR